MELASLKEAVPGLADKSHNDLIKIFAWFLQVHKNKATFTGADIGQCYTKLDFAAPSSFGGYFKNLLDRRDILKSGGGYKLEHKVRAAVVMVWNIAFSHLCDHVLAKHLKDFNDRWLLSMPGMHKNKTKTIAVMDDFNDHLKESEVLSICRDGNIIGKNIYNIMHASLGKRNAAAHPSTVIIDKLQADAYIMDLITNVVLKIV